MNIKQIRYYVSTVEHGSLSAAAKRHFVTVQTLSKALGDLEKELGESLFIRRSHGVEPTLFGNAFYQKSKTVLQEFDKLEAFGKQVKADAQTTQSDVLKLALIAPKFYRYLSACDNVAAFVKRTVGIEAKVSLSSVGDGLGALRTGQLDALLSLGSISHEEVNCISVGTAPLAVLMMKGHPLESVDEIRLKDLQRYPLLTSDGFDLINEDFVSTYRSLGVEIEYKHVSLLEVMRFVVQDKGLIFAIGIPALGGMLSGARMKLVAPEDAYPIPLCLTSLKECSSPAYFAFEHCLINRIVFPMRELS